MTIPEVAQLIDGHMLYLLIVRDQVPLNFPLRPLLTKLIIGNLLQVVDCHLGGHALHATAGCPLWAGLLLGLRLFLVRLLGRLWTGHKREMEEELCVTFLRINRIP